MPDKLRKVLHAFSALADLGAEIADADDFDEMVASSLHVVLGAVGVRRGAVAEYDASSSSLRLVAAHGLGEPAPPDIPFAPIEAEALARSDDPFVDARAGGPPLLSERAASALRAAGLRLAMPLLVRGDLVGMILLGENARGDEFSPEDRETLRALGRHVGVGLHNHRLLREVARRAEENLRLYDDLRDVYQNTVRAFAAAIDCKDKYTQGHSERVGKYSELIAREMGMPDEAVEGIAIAGYLHDVGKLVVDRDIINAPYRIDAKQSSELSRHPSAGYEILSPIRHPYADIPLATRYHHERPDGRGYPEGLKGDEIPPVARIVSLADSFDAMTTDRPYKRRREFPEVVEDLRRNAGRQFAPEVVVAFCRALLRELTGETRPRQIVRLLGKNYIDEEVGQRLLEELILELEAGASSAAGGH